MSYPCLYCSHRPFDSRRALSQHQLRKKSCLASMKASMKVDNGYMTAHEFLVCVSSHQSQKKLAEALLAKVDGQKTVRFTSMLPKESQQCDSDRQQLDGYSTAAENNSEDEFPDFDADNEEEDADDEEDNSDNEAEMVPVIDRSMLDDFHEYCHLAEGFAPFPAAKSNAIKLMVTLRKTKASLATYNTVMEWHLKATGQMQLNESVGSSK